MANELTAARLREVLNYCPESGVWTWVKPTYKRHNHLTGTIAGRTGGNGYLQIQIDGRHYLVHRLAFLFMTGEWPPDQVDHINRDKRDNRWSNLRLATMFQNMGNRPALSRNKAGLKGVSWDKGKWKAQIKANGVSRYLGRFDTPTDAHAAYLAAAREAFGEYHFSGNDQQLLVA